MEKETPVYLKHGFKKLVGGILSVIGGIICLIPFKNQGMYYIGVGIAGIGAALLGVGVVHTAVKVNKGIDRSENVWRDISDKLKQGNIFKKGK